VFGDPEKLRHSNIEPPVLAELFARLAHAGQDLGQPPDVDAAARALLAWRAAASGGTPLQTSPPRSPAPPDGNLAPPPRVPAPAREP
jgi:hypothetical protein